MIFEKPVSLRLSDRPLGKTGIRVSPLCYGCAGAYARNLISDQTATSLFRTAYEGGIRFFDTGHSYGRAEERIGMALRELAIKRETVVLSTKFGTRFENGRYIHDVSTEWAKRSIEQSLNRIGTDYIDLLYIHGARCSDFSSELLTFLEDQKRQGIIRAAGINTFQAEPMWYAVENRCFDAVMLDYNIAKRGREPVIQALAEAGVGVVAGQALAEGVYLKTLYRIRKPKDIWYLARTLGRPASRELYRTGRRYRFLNQVKEADGAQIALKYVLDNPHIASASIGTCDFGHLNENIQAQYIRIPDRIRERIRSI